MVKFIIGYVIGCVTASLIMFIGFNIHLMGLLEGKINV